MNENDDDYVEVEEMAFNDVPGNIDIVEFIIEQRIKLSARLQSLGVCS